MDSVQHNALKRREDLRRELQDVERFLALYDRFKVESPQRAFPGFIDTETPEQEEDRSGASAKPVVETVSATEGEKVLTGLNRLQLRPHIAAVIQEAGRPLSRGQLLRKLDQRGVQVGGNYDRSKNMGTIMWRLRDDFVNLSGRGYWPRRTPFPEAGYAPGSELWDAEVTSDLDETLG